MAFWSERATRFKADPRANTNDLWLRELEINYVDQKIKSQSFKRIMDFGCANGYSTFRLAEMHKDLTFVGIDINSGMIDIANERLNKHPIPNLFFRNVDVINENIKEKYDFIYSIRVFQNLDSLDTQINVFDRIYNLINKNGAFLYVESYADGYKKLNADRAEMGLPPLPIHEHLTLLTDEFDHYVSKRLKFLSRDHLSSSYYLITRLLYSYIAKMNKEPIDYDHPIHRVAAIVPQVGDYGPQKASYYTKKGRSDA